MLEGLISTVFLSFPLFLGINVSIECRYCLPLVYRPRSSSQRRSVRWFPTEHGQKTTTPGYYVYTKAQSAAFGATPQLMHLALADPSIRRKRHERVMSIVMGSGPSFPYFLRVRK